MVVVGMVAGVFAADVLAPVAVLLGGGCVLVVGAGAGGLAALAVAPGVVAVVVALLRALAAAVGRPDEPHPPSTEANAISRSHLRIRGRLPRERVAGVLSVGSLIT